MKFVESDMIVPEDYARTLQLFHIEAFKTRIERKGLKIGNGISKEICGLLVDSALSASKTDSPLNELISYITVGKYLGTSLIPLIMECSETTMDVTICKVAAGQKISLSRTSFGVSSWNKPGTSSPITVERVHHIDQPGIVIGGEETLYLNVKTDDGTVTCEFERGKPSTLHIPLEWHVLQEMNRRRYIARIMLHLKLNVVGNIIPWQSMKTGKRQVEYIMDNEVPIFESENKIIYHTIKTKNPFKVRASLNNNLGIVHDDRTIGAVKRQMDWGMRARRQIMNGLILPREREEYQKIFVEMFTSIMELDPDTFSPEDLLKEMTRGLIGNLFGPKIANLGTSGPKQIYTEWITPGTLSTRPLRFFMAVCFYHFIPIHEGATFESVLPNGEIMNLAHDTKSFMKKPYGYDVCGIPVTIGTDYTRFAEYYDIKELASESISSQTQFHSIPSVMELQLPKAYIWTQTGPSQAFRRKRKINMDDRIRGSMKWANVEGVKDYKRMRIDDSEDEDEEWYGMF
jgi:hypothetical protein